jgi:hypothetical protein
MERSDKTALVSSFYESQVDEIRRTSILSSIAEGI